MSSDRQETATTRYSIGLWIATLFTGVGAVAILWIIGDVLHKTFPRFDQPDIPLEPLLDGALTAVFITLMLLLAMLLGAGVLAAGARIVSTVRVESGETTNQKANETKDNET